MKTTRQLRWLLLLAIFSTTCSYAFDVGGAREYCKKPQFREFTPPRRVDKQPFVEVMPETQIAFKATGTIDPGTIKVFAKKIQLAAKIVDKKSFWQITAKLPAELRGFVRINVFAEAPKRECIGKDGWLIKIKDSGSGAASNPPTLTLDK